MSFYISATTKIEEGFLKKAFTFSVVVHSLFMMMTWEAPAPEKDLRDNAIKVEFVQLPEPMITKKIVKVEAVKPMLMSPEKKVVKKVVKQKIDKGTLKQVANSKHLGDPKAAKVQDVQKGDPASKNMTAYKPGTDFRKLQAANVGTGGRDFMKTDSLGGGSGDTYKGGDFAIKSLSASKMGKRFTISKIDDGGAGTGSTGGVGDGRGRGFGDGTITGTVGGTLEKAKILTNVGSLTGATTGIIGTSKGAEGLSTKGTIALAGTPEDTVVMGSMDPNLIRKILLEHLAQFRYCYQSELERVEDIKVSGVLNLNFDIGPNGGVKRVDVTGAEAINRTIKGCVAGVLRGISFPEPMGGGVVEVKQPMNFYSKYN